MSNRPNPLYPGVMPPSPLLPQKPKTYARKNANGLIEILDSETHRILCVQSTPEDLLEHKWERLTRIDTPEGPVFLEKGLNLDHTRFIRSTPFSQLLGDLICQAVAEGQTTVRACAQLNLPYATYIKWRRDNPEFKESLRQAEIDRSDALHDEVLDEARAHTTDAKTKISALQWSAERINQEKYGTKTKIIGDANAPLTFFIETGIRRSGDAGFTTPTDPTILVEPTDEEREDKALNAFIGEKIEK